MLGLRRFNNVQIDIWQGDINQFAADGEVRFQVGNTPAIEIKANNHNSHARFAILILIKNPQLTTDNERLAMYENIFRQSDAYGIRHLTLPMPPLAPFDEKITDSLVKTGMLALSNYLKSVTPQQLARVTFVADDLNMYHSLQKHLFAEFPDELDEEGF